MMATARTPAGPRGVLCQPPLSEWSALAAANRAAAKEWSFDIQGVPASRLRAAVRRRLLHRLGGAPEEGEGEGPLLFGTGHQPEFYHPGVWMKSFAVTAAARAAGGRAFNWVVDHDAGGLAAEIPRRGGTGGGSRTGPGDLDYVVRTLTPRIGGRPFETLSGPALGEAEAFVEAVDGDLATVGLGRERDLWRVFADGLLRLVEEGAGGGRPSSAGGLSAAETGWRSRSAYERALGCRPAPDVPLSEVSGTREFLLFFVHWVVHARELLDVYNAALAEVRAARRLRSRANPFPDLLVRPDGAVELPFWALTAAGVRRKLYVRKDGDALVLSHLEGDAARLPAKGGQEAAEALAAAGVPVRPRAVPLTMFTRLFAADVFVHGTGGARYDEVTDRVIEKFFGVSPPRFAVVSATVHLPLGDLPVQPSALGALRQKLRELRFNPQRHAWEVAGVDPELDRRLGQLLREKERLIDEIRRAPRAGRGRRENPSVKRSLTRAIEKTNGELYRLLGAVERQTEAELARLQRRARAGAAAARRTYPFFLYDPKELWTLLMNGGA